MSSCPHRACPSRTWPGRACRRTVDRTITQWTELAQISANDNSKSKGKTGTSRGGKKGTVATPSKGSQPTPEPGMGEVITAGLTFALIVGGGLFAFPEMAKAIGVLPTDEPRDPPVDPPSSPPRSSSRNDRLYVPYADAKDEMAAAAADAEALWKTRPKPSGSGSPAEKNEPEKLEETIDVTKESKTEDVVVEEAEVVAEEAVVMQTVDSPNVNSALGDLISSPLFYVTFGVAGSVALIQALEAAGVENAEFALSALPIVLLTAISKTTFGESLQKNIEDQRPALEAEKARAELERSAARGKMDGHYGPNRRKFLPQSFGYTSRITWTVRCAGTWGSTRFVWRRRRSLWRGTVSSSCCTGGGRCSASSARRFPKLWRSSAA